MADDVRWTINAIGNRQYFGSALNEKCEKGKKDGK